MAGGSTPKTTEEDKYYCEKDGGIPFIRVQNISEEGLMLDDCKYINKTTHDTILARSKVFENDLIVKITGVGRMAISAVAPQGFEGNINQHSVVIKTKNRSVSEAIAAYLNSDIAEKLASRRSTGGTRPALDYKALRSMPIIYDDRIADIMKKAYIKKQTIINDTKILMNSIDEYLLEILNINVCNINADKKRSFFIVQSNNVIEGRFDPKKYTKGYKEILNAIDNGNFNKIKLKDLIIESRSGEWGEDGSDTIIGYKKCLVIRATEFMNNENLNIENSRAKYRNISEISLQKMNISAGDILIEKSGGSENQPVGRVAIITQDLLDNNTIAYSNFINKIKIDNKKVNSYYLFEFLRLTYNLRVTEVMQNQTNGIRNLIMSEYLNQTIILPDMIKQIEIANHIKKIRNEALKMKKEADKVVDTAKKYVEKILFGGK